MCSLVTGRKTVGKSLSEDRQLRSNLLKVTSKLLYHAFKNKKQVPPTAQKKFQEKYRPLQSDWKEIYSLPFRVTIETIDTRISIQTIE